MASELPEIGRIVVAAIEAEKNGQQPASMGRSFDAPLEQGMFKHSVLAVLGLVDTDGSVVHKREIVNNIDDYLWLKARGETKRKGKIKGNK